MNKQQTPLVDAWAADIDKNRLLQHMPGHKGETAGGLAQFGALAAWDVTEADGLDDLHAPEGAIAEAAVLLAQAVGVRQAHLLVNGATVGIQAAILAACAPGETLLLPRNAHRAAWSALALGDIAPLWLSVAMSADGLPLGITPRQLDEALAANPQVKSVFLVYPSFYGVCVDLAGLLAVCRRHGVISIVDEAHGAHFPFTAPLKSAARLGADLVIDSWHKSMGSLGQTAVLLNNTDLQPERWLTLLQTSSPSYPLLASLDAARAEWCAYAEDRAQKIADDRKNLAETLRQTANLCLVGVDDLPSDYAYDETKALLYSVGGHSGWQIADVLREVGVEPEFADNRHVLFLLTYAGPEDERQRLAAALLAADKLLDALKPQQAVLPLQQMPLPDVKLRPFAAAHAPVEWLPMQQAVGRVAAGLITPYPPGIPWVGPGEVVSAELVARLAELLPAGGRVQGLRDNLLPVIIA